MVHRKTCCWSRNALENRTSAVYISQSTSKFPSGTCSNKFEIDIWLKIYISRQILIQKEEHYVGISWERNSLFQPLGWCCTTLHSNFCSILLPTKYLHKAWVCCSKNALEFRPNMHDKSHNCKRHKWMKGNIIAQNLLPDSDNHGHWKEHSHMGNHVELLFLISSLEYLGIQWQQL